MQVYAAGLVYNAMRVAQSEAAEKLGVAPERDLARTGLPSGGRRLLPLRAGAIVGARSPPTPSTGTFPPGPASPPVGVRVAGADSHRHRTEHRQHQRFCAARRTWKAFAHVRGAVSSPGYLSGGEAENAAPLA